MYHIKAKSVKLIKHLDLFYNVDVIENLKAVKYNKL